APAHPLVTELLQAALGVQAHIHADLEKDVDDAGVLADGPASLGAHARVGQDLGNGVLGRRAFLALVGARQVLDVVGGMVITDELHRVGHGLDQVIFLDEGCHNGLGCKNRELDGYLPVQTGLRFSAKAVAPSLASADAKIGAVRGRCRSNMSDWRQSLEAEMISFAACTASGPFWAMTRPMARAPSSALPGSTRRLTRPK